MGYRNADIIPGDVYIASWNSSSQIVDTIKKVSETTCGTEPIILVGHSLGANTIMGVLQDDIADIPIALVITEDIANVGDTRYERKSDNVQRHINFSSDNSLRNVAVKLTIGVPDIVEGAENWTVAGSNHNNLDHEYLDEEQKQPNQIWTMFREAVFRLKP